MISSLYFQCLSAVYIIFFCINNCRQKKYNYKIPNIKGAIHICQAIVAEEKKKIDCMIVVTISEIQLLGNFSKQVKGRTIKLRIILQLMLFSVMLCGEAL